MSIGSNSDGMNSLICEAGSFRKESMVRKTSRKCDSPGPISSMYADNVDNDTASGSQSPNYTLGNKSLFQEKSKLKTDYFLREVEAKIPESLSRMTC